MSPKSPSPRRRYVRFTRWRQAHFFRVLEETGHVQMAAEAAGVSLACIYRLRRVEAGFTEKMAAARDKADARLEAQEGGQSLGTVTSDCPSQQALVIRRGIGGRLRVTAAGRNWWTERHDPLFFEHLRATGCVAASARAAGFTPKTAWNRRERLPGFARAMDEAREDSDLALEFQLCAQGQRKRGDDWGGSPAAVPAERAIRTLSFRENRRRGKHKPRRAKPPGMEAVTGKIERLARAVKRHREGPP
jgi:molybdenum-dependent DNA-binding transcriptional regulator ModE